MPLKTIIFDFDGTLVDSLGVKYQARFDLFDQDPPHVQAIAKELIPQIRGKLRAEIIREIMEQTHKGTLTSDAFEEKVQEYVKRYDTLVEDRIVSQGLFPGVRELLERLNLRYHLYVNSGTPQYALQQLTDKMDISRHFHGIHGIDPSRKEAAGIIKLENLEKILRAGSVAGEEALVIGDGIEDLDSARVCGCKFVGIASERNGWVQGSEFPLLQTISDLSNDPLFSEE